MLISYVGLIQEDGANVGLESEAEDSGSSTQDLLNALKDNMTQNDGVISDTENDLWFEFSIHS